MVITLSILITIFEFTLSVLAASWRVQWLGSWIWGRNYLSIGARGGVVC